MMLKISVYIPILINSDCTSESVGNFSKTQMPYPRPMKSATLGVGPSTAFYNPLGDFDVHLGLRTTGLSQVPLSPLTVENVFYSPLYLHA